MPPPEALSKADDPELWPSEQEGDQWKAPNRRLVLIFWHGGVFQNSVTPSNRKMDQCFNMVNRSKRLPTPNCLSSRRVRESMPHSVSMRRRILGHHLPGIATPLALDQVSHGGPASKEVTNPSRMPCSQKLRVSIRLTSPQHASTTRSKEIVWSTNPSSVEPARSK